MQSVNQPVSKERNACSHQGSSEKVIQTPVLTAWKDGGDDLLKFKPRSLATASPRPEAFANHTEKPRAASAGRAPTTGPRRQHKGGHL